jgi:hypothetical protein
MAMGGLGVPALIWVNAEVGDEIRYDCEALKLLCARGGPRRARREFVKLDIQVPEGVPVVGFVREYDGDGLWGVLGGINTEVRD